MTSVVFMNELLSLGSLFHALKLEKQLRGLQLASPILGKEMFRGRPEPYEGIAEQAELKLQFVSPDCDLDVAYKYERRCCTYLPSCRGGKPSVQRVKTIFAVCGACHGKEIYTLYLSEMYIYCIHNTHNTHPDFLTILTDH